MSLKAKNIVVIPLTTGGTVALVNGVYTAPLSSVPLQDDLVSDFRIEGTQSLASNFVISMSSPVKGTVQRFLWVAACTPNAFSAIILGTTIPTHLLSKKFILEAQYNGSAWVNTITPDIVQTAGIDGQSVVDATISSSKLTAKAVDYTKMQDVSAYSLPVRASGTSGVLGSLAIAANSVLGRIAGNIENITATVNGQVLKMTGGALGFSTMAFSELTGTVANAQIPDNEITLAKQQSTGLLGSAYTNVLTTAVTTEEVAYTYTLPAATLAANGKALKISVAGSTAANGNTKTIRVKVGGVTVLTNTVTTAPNNKEWRGEMIILRSSATTGVSKGDMAFDNAHEGVQVITGSAITWGNSNAIEVTLQNGSASAGDITLSLVVIELLK